MQNLPTHVILKKYLWDIQRADNIHFDHSGWIWTGLEVHMKKRSLLIVEDIQPLHTLPILVILEHIFFKREMFHVLH